MAISVQKYDISMGLEETDLISNRSDIILERSLIEAATLGHTEEVLAHLNNGVSVDAVEYSKFLYYAMKNYVTPLQMAAACGHHNTVQLLINHKADLNASDRLDMTALHMAAENGNYHCVKLLLESGAMCSIQTKSSKLVCYTDAPYVGQTTALHLSANNNHVDCVKELIQNGADYNAVNEMGHTSLYIASKNGYSECVLAHLKECKYALSLPSYDSSDTPLHFCVYHNMTECVRGLLSLGSDVHHINYAGLAPIHLALSLSNEKIPEPLELVKLLILEGFNVNINCPDASGFTPLHYVCFNGYLMSRRPELAKFLISHGADTSIRNRGFTLLEHELKYNDNNYDILKYVIKSMLSLPHLSSLNLGTYPRSHYEYIKYARMHHAHERHNYEDPISEDSDDEADSDDMMEIIEVNGENPLEHEVENLELINIQNLMNQPAILQKRSWYKEISSNPRSLQHHCRHNIRNCLGPKKLKYIKYLQIPPAVQSYLWLED